MFSCTQILQPLLLALLSNLILPLTSLRASLVAQMIKNLPAMQETQETWVWSLGQEDPLEKDPVFSSILAWGISRTEEPGGAVGLQRVDHDTTDLSNQPPPPFTEPLPTAFKLPSLHLPRPFRPPSTRQPEQSH